MISLPFLCSSHGRPHNRLHDKRPPRIHLVVFRLEQTRRPSRLSPPLLLFSHLVFLRRERAPLQLVYWEEPRPHGTSPFLVGTYLSYSVPYCQAIPPPLLARNVLPRVYAIDLHN